MIPKIIKEKMVDLVSMQVFLLKHILKNTCVLIFYIKLHFKYFNRNYTFYSKTCYQKAV